MTSQQKEYLSEMSIKEIVNTIFFRGMHYMHTEGKNDVGEEDEYLDACIEELERRESFCKFMHQHE